MAPWPYILLVHFAPFGLHDSTRANKLELPGIHRTLNTGIKNNHGANPSQNVECDPFRDSMRSMGFDESTQGAIQTKVRQTGFTSSHELSHLARDFTERPEVFSTLLISDFGFSPLLAHQTRAAIMVMLDKENDKKAIILEEASKNDENVYSRNDEQSLKQGAEIENAIADTTSTTTTGPGTGIDAALLKSDAESKETAPNKKKPLFKSVIVNAAAQKRRSTSDSSSQSHDYGLPSNYRELYPTLAVELDAFYSFMTKPTTLSQDVPIRKATADVYMRHAKLFLGWYITEGNNSVSDGNKKKNASQEDQLSVFSVIKNKEKVSANVVLDFVMFLRTSRSISDSYEANLLRGITKLLKFRFAEESECDPAYSGKSFEDIAIIREIRKLHRLANKKQSLSSRSSDEQRKWLSWPEFLKVVQSIKADLLVLIKEHEQLNLKTKTVLTSMAKKKVIAREKKIATAYQQYLVLAFFASIPDRQRTIRELEIGTSFVQDENSDSWVVKHGPDEYKTGKTYGERVLVLAQELSPSINDFIEHWRPSLMPKTKRLFAQPRTGNPLTQDSVYQIVARTCYKYSGKRTNPHLLRDMIVTHVRESNASEKQLEALALYMGHSIHMQRTSYDRRTLKKKVAPAVELLRSVNELGSN